MEINQITGDVLDAAIKVHQKFGPGLLESVYEKILAIELEKRGHKVACQKPLPIHYEERTITDAFRMDLLVDGLVVVELKSTAQMNPVFFKQLRTYLVLSGLQVGLLINFGMNTLKEGFKRIVNNYGISNNSASSAFSARGNVSHAEDAENAEGGGVLMQILMHKATDAELVRPWWKSVLKRDPEGEAELFKIFQEEMDDDSKGIEADIAKFRPSAEGHVYMLDDRMAADEEFRTALYKALREKRKEDPAWPLLRPDELLGTIENPDPKKKSNDANSASSALSARERTRAENAENAEVGAV